jgi:hypothetical protein
MSSSCNVLYLWCNHCEMLYTLQRIHEPFSSPGFFLPTWHYPRFYGDNTNPVTTGILPPFPGVTHRFWEVTTTKRVQTPQTKVKITLMELSDRYV